ncbi:tyrosine-protein phosphatase non-receptor type 23-like [Myripristis murdjan]|uniref:tyrosine-protein phosphatase non-receptor type 23-like n=1 Tax=Myripristis murdjan TaxID=586833 RepID=UPI00117633E7|nr:tyrosine-protein phosphatase non-receptor type 23-like [Myripristis murdjan]
MMAACGFLWALTMAMLTQDICSYPVKKDFEPSSSYGSGHHTNSAPAALTSTQYSPGAFIPGVASSEGVSMSTTYQAVPRRQPGYQRQPATSYSSSSFSRPESGYEGGSSRPLENPQMPDLTQPSAPFQPDSPPGFSWSVEPSLFRSTEETSFGSSEMAPAPPVPGYVSPPVPDRLIPPPSGPEFQPGEMSHFENHFEHGNYQRETEEQGYQPPPPGIPVPAELEGFTSEPHPRPRPFWFGGRYPYDFMFLTGQYPPGTVTHFSSSYEHGRDHWQDAHYERIHEPFSASEEQSQTYPSDFSDLQSYQQPQLEVPSYLPYSKGVDEVGQTTDEEGTASVPYHGGYSQPNLSDQSSVSSQTSGYNMGKVSGY